MGSRAAGSRTLLPVTKEPDLAALLGELVRADHPSPLSTARFVSNRTLEPVSDALLDGARNLLEKAYRDLERGDLERAAALVDRAVALPFDDHEQAYPALLAGFGLLFGAVVEALEDCDDDDHTWLDAATAVIDGLGPDAVVLGAVLLTVLHDFDVTPAESRRIVRAVSGTTAADEFREALGDDRSAHRREVLNALRATVAYERALDQLA